MKNNTDEYINILNVRSTLRGWLRQHSWDVAATFTFADEVSQQIAQHRMRLFWNDVDRRLYGNAVKRYNKRCNRVNIIEGGWIGQRTHCHSAIKMPDERFDSVEAFSAFLDGLWREKYGRHFQIEFKTISNSYGWSGYITKQIERDNCDRLDVHSSHIAAPLS